MVAFARCVDSETRIKYVSHAAHCLYSNGDEQRGLALLLALAQESEQQSAELRFRLWEEAAWMLTYGGGTQEQASKVIAKMVGIASGVPELEERLDSIRALASWSKGDRQHDGFVSPFDEIESMGSNDVHNALFDDLQVLAKDDLVSPLDETESMASNDVHNAILEELQDLANADNDPCSNVHHWPGCFGEHLKRLAELGEREAALGYLEKSLIASESLSSSLGWQRAAVFVGLTELALALAAPASQVDRLIDRANESLAIAPDVPGAAATLGTIENMKDELFEFESRRNIDKAIEIAWETKDANKRRERLAKLYARSKRWADVHQVLAEAASETEVLELCWAIRFEISEY